MSSIYDLEDTLKMMHLWVQTTEETEITEKLGEAISSRQGTEMMLWGVANDIKQKSKFSGENRKVSSDTIK